MQALNEPRSCYTVFCINLNLVAATFPFCMFSDGIQLPESQTLASYGFQNYVRTIPREHSHHQ